MEQRDATFRAKYRAGMIVGAAPLVLFCSTFSAFGFTCLGSRCPTSTGANPFGTLTVLALALYGAMLALGLVCLAVRGARPLGYGLLTMAFVDPIVGGIGCTLVYIVQTKSR